MSISDFSIITQKINNLHSKIRQDDGHLLFDYSEKKHTFKNKNLTKFYVRKLLDKLRINKSVIEKCLKSPLSNLAKVLELSHRIAKGKLSYDSLIQLKDLLGDDLKIISSQLKNPIIFQDVKGFIERHIY